MGLNDSVAKKDENDFGILKKIPKKSENLNEKLANPKEYSISIDGYQ